MSRDVFVNECVQYYRYTLTHIGIHCVGRVLMVQLLFFFGGGGGCHNSGDYVTSFYHKRIKNVGNTSKPNC